VLYATNTQGAQLSRRLEKDDVPHQWLGNRTQKMAYDAERDALTLLTIHSSKGLEFERVIMIGIGQMEDEGEQRQQSARLLYVGMTRARRYLLMASSGENEFSRRIVDAEGLGGDALLPSISMGPSELAGGV
jgi:superfamily I DNA/RNA helicase